MRKFGPLDADADLVKGGLTCPGCRKPFAAGDSCVLVAIGPGADEESRKACREGGVYNAVAIPAHYACVTGEE